MTKLSVNINKIATIRNARGGNNPNLLKMARDIQSYGAQGITIHPRPDQRHITYKDAIDLLKVISTEFNIEGNPIEKFIDLVCKIKPDQVTLVPDSVDAITSNSGWDTIKNKSFLKEVVSEFKNNGIRTSIFIDTDLKLIEGAKIQVLIELNFTQNHLLLIFKKAIKRKSTNTLMPQFWLMI